MSKENAMEFFKKAETEPELQRKLAALEQQYLEKISALAKESGFEITPEDFSEEVQPLSDGEMADAAGGDSNFAEAYRRQQQVLAGQKRH